MFFYVLNCRNESVEAKLKEADCWSRLGDIGVETGKMHYNLETLALFIYFLLVSGI